MTTAGTNPTHLRLVGADKAHDGRPSPGSAAEQVAVENVRAAGNAGLDPTDPRWVLAVRTYAHLQGAALPQDRRERLMQTARRLGIRPFEANVIMAVVQEQARRGARLDAAAGTLALLETPKRASSGPIWLRLGVAFLCGAVGTALLIRWVTG